MENDASILIYGFAGNNAIGFCKGIIGLWF